jgi:hypothetical protein
MPITFLNKKKSFQGKNIRKPSLSPRITKTICEMT